MRHKLKSSLAGLRLFSLTWSDRAAKFIMLSMVAVIFFLLGVGVSLLKVSETGSLFVKRVHTEHVTVIPEKAAPPIGTSAPIMPRIINANPLPTIPASTEHGATDRGNETPSTAPANPSGLADVPQSTVAPRSETEERESVRCLQPNARALLDAIEKQFGTMRVISTCRPGATIAGSGNPSRHRYGLAIDFVAPDGKKSAVLAWLIKNHRAGGVMTYSDSDHIHVDIGPHFVSLAGERRERHRKRRADDDD